MGNRSWVVVLTGIAGLVGCGSDGAATPNHGSSGNASIGGESSVGGSGVSGGTTGGRNGATTGGTSAGGAATAGADDMAEAGTGGQAPESACDAYATARCTRIQACSSRRFQTYYSSLADCERAVRETCNGELDAPGSNGTAEAIATCAKESAAQNCGDFLSLAPASCTVAGSLPAGAACVFNSQCESTYCQPGGTSWCGVCKARDGLGKACDDTSCERGLRCGFGCPIGETCTDGDKQFRCVKMGVRGDPCANPGECRRNLTCLGGICTTGHALGESCDPNIGGSCEFSADLLCLDSASGPTCVHNSYHSGGEACDEGTANYCSGLGACVGTDGHLVPDGPGTCNAPAAAGEPCSGADELCQQPALCFDGVCTSPVGVTCH